MNENKSKTSLILSIVAILLVIVGGVTLFKRSKSPAPAPKENTNQVATTTTAETPKGYSTSADLEADINSIDVSSLDLNN